MYEDSPEDLVMGQLTENVWAGQPLGREILGTKQTVSGIAAIRCGGMRMNSTQAGESTSPYRERWTSSGLSMCAGICLPPARRAMRLRKERRRSIKNPRFSRKRILSRTISASAIADLICSIRANTPFPFSPLCLAAGMSSRLFRKIREDAGLAYTVQSYGTAYRDAGIFCIYTALAPKSEKECLERIRKELDAVKRDRGLPMRRSPERKNSSKRAIMDMETPRRA